MADRPHPVRLIAVPVIAALTLAGCGDSPEPAPPATLAAAGDSQAEADLRKQAAALQKTILQGALAGAAAGGGISIGLGGDSDDIATGISLGLAAGAAAGTYVGFVQRKYANKEKRLNQIKSDLDRNAAEMQTTINVMQEVLAVQQSELAALRAKVAAGEATQDQLQTELAEANANLATMQVAIDGATKRQAEFGEARGLTVAKGATTSPVDPDLAALSNQITAMKSVAADLAASI